MAWIYLAASEVSASPSSRGSDQSPIVKTTDTLKLFSCRECKTEHLGERRFGMTCVPCPEMPSETWKLTSSSAVSHARISALLDMVWAWTVSEAAFIGSCTDSWWKQNRPSFSSRTSRPSEPEDLKQWCGHLPTSGMTVDGRLYQPPKLVPLTSADAGSYLPTPTAKHYGSNRGGAAGRVGESRHSIHQMATRGLLPGHAKGALNREYLELVMGYPLRWTVIGAWAIAWCQPPRAKRSKGSSE